MENIGQKNLLRPATAKLVARLLVPLLDSGVVGGDEYSLITSNLNHLAKHGTPSPAIQPKLIDPQEAAELLAISYSQFRALEKEGAFPFRRRMVGGKTVRYLNLDIINYMLTESEVAVEEA